MDVKEFVSESLKQIIDGATEAARYAEGKGATIESPTKNTIEFDKS